MANSLFGKARAALGQRSGAGHDRDLGDQARDRSDWRDAAEHYQTYLSLNPGDFSIWVQLGHASKEAGDLGRAEQAYLRALALDPSDADLLLNLGHLLKRQGRVREAVDQYRRSYEVDRNGFARIELESLNLQIPSSEVEPSVVARTDVVEFSRPAGPNRWVGTIDAVDGIEVRGWAIDPDASNTPAELEAALSDGRIIGMATASRHRPDVIEAGFGQTTAGFSIFLDAPDLAGVAVDITIRLRTTGEPLEGSPLSVTLPRDTDISDDSRIDTARYVVAKPLHWRDGEHAIFVAYAATGMLQPFVRRYLTMLRANEISVSLVVNTDRPVLLDDDLLDLVDGAVIRENRGYDFGAWAHMLHIEPKLYAADALYIINDSVFGPRDEAAFGAMIARVRANPAELVGLTQTLDRGWHIQSYFMRVAKPLLASYAFQFFVNDIRVVEDKDRIIDLYEVPLARRVRESGFDVSVIYPVDEARNPTLFAWKPLFDRDFPFAKLLLLKGGFPHIESGGMRKAMKRAGFDMKLLDETLEYRSHEPPMQGAFPLLARPVSHDPQSPVATAKPYKVAFYGPWNYDNGLGSASRGIVSAIRQTGVRLNLHPIKTPFHIHKPMGPAHDIVDFDGVADIAIVHLNPDSWHLLTPEQLRDIRRARKRIGYWVWEMEHLPMGWRREFSSVDRIWAPSGYCADVFEAQDEAPVDIVPHAVPVDRATQGIANRNQVLGALGVNPERRVILYIFDGSSYLVRKNPAALVRGFAASGLATRGWTLVLKTKHLMDRPEDGAAFAALAHGTEGVVLLDRSLTSGELADLLEAADIYASPHCSEGFGLTVAEAMAAGKSVVATDYSGTRQFLDAACGYPVRAERWTLEDDFGHYTVGGTWAKIDEAALADALDTAATRIEAGDRSVGETARARIAQDLSYEAVGAAVAASFDAVLHDTKPVRRMPERLDSVGDAGVRLDRFDGGSNLGVLPLTAGTLTPVSGASTKRGLDCVANEPGRWLMLVPEDGRVHPMTAKILARSAATRPDVAIFYADDVAFGGETLYEQVRLKPEFDPFHFAAQDFIGAPVFIRGSALHELGGLTADAGDGTIYDLVLRAAEHGMSVARLPEVLLVQPDRRPELAVAVRKPLVAGSPLFAGYAVSDGLTPQTLRLSARFDGGKPAVTLCIPTRRSAISEGADSSGPMTFIERFLESVARVDWPADRLTVLVGDDVEGVPDWEQRDWPFTLRRIETVRAPGEAFNYSAKMNTLWRAAETDVIVLMNDDVEARDADWLSALVGFAVDRSVGGVGARLLFDDGTIQHAGMVGGIFGTSVHAWLGRRSGAPTYQDWALVHRQWSMVTGAVFATRRSVLEAVGGFDEGFALEFNDVDLCLKMRQTGYRIVYTPFAEMTHSEKASRGDTIPPGEQVALFLSRWQAWLKDDPALHPRIRRDMMDLAPAVGRESWFV